jgi:hypothetical protein
MMVLLPLRCWCCCLLRCLLQLLVMQLLHHDVLLL